MSDRELTLTEGDLDEALQAAREQAEAATSEPYGAGFIQAAEFMHRYLLERDRLKAEPDRTYPLRE